MTDTLQPHHRAPAPPPRRPAGDPKADRQRYYVLGHGSHLLDTARYLGGPIDAHCGPDSRARPGHTAGSSRPNIANGCLGQLDLTLAVRMDW